MSAKDGRPELTVEDATLRPGTLFLASGRFWRMLNGAFLNDNDSEIVAFIAPVDTHTSVPSYNPLPVLVSSAREAGRRTFTVDGTLLRPNLLRGIFRDRLAYFTVIQPGVARVSVKLSVVV